MNVSQPVASYVESVEFGFLTSRDIKDLSVKRVQNPTTFDTLLHPVPGGLYDAALGAWSDNPLVYESLSFSDSAIILIS
jgi:DNA-directed RNA polymerase I subunit RPA1